MEKDDENLFRKLTNINLVRQCIFKQLPSADDICNFSKVSRDMYNNTNEDVIKKNIKWYTDMQIIKIRPIESNLPTKSPMKLRNIKFEKDENNLNMYDELKCFNGETARNWNCITITIENSIQKLRKFDRVPFFKRLAREVNINCERRKDVKILSFILKANFNHQMLLYTLGYMKHDRVERITIPSAVFLSDALHPKEIKCSIFEGFPELRELSIYITPNYDYFSNDFMNENIMDHVFKEFSRKEGAKILLTDADYVYGTFPNIVNLILIIATKYQIKITCNGCSLFKMINNFNSPFEIDNLQLKDLITSVEFSTPGSKVFPELIRQLELLRNLQKLSMQFHFFIIHKAFSKSKMSNLNYPSLKNSTNLKEVKLVFIDFAEECELYEGRDYVEQTIIDNIKFLASLMPRTIEKLELWYFNNMSKEVSDIIAEHMPNIKVLKTYKVKSRDAKWLLSFKNLQVYITHNKDMIEIPSSVELLGIKNSHIYGGANDDPVEKYVVDYYTSKYTKCFNNESNEFYFFNKIEQWISFKQSTHKF
uniref:F-box domain-containing protein n=1 Tax=Strongyloides venezuelensis TaxID=75913 RepID=A0A0K0EXR6_STRVS